METGTTIPRSFGRMSFTYWYSPPNQPSHSTDTSVASLTLAPAAERQYRYGGKWHQTARGLLVTSPHPAEAGLTRSLLRVLDGAASAIDLGI